MVRSVTRVFLIVLALFLALAFVAVAVEWVVLPWVLLSGWWPSAGRMLSAIHLSTSGISWSAVTFLILVVGSHEFLSWVGQPVSATTAAAGSGTSGEPWRWRWTFGLHAGMWLTLFAAMSLAGLTHQAAWLAASDEPVFKHPLAWLNSRSQLKRAAIAIRGEAAEAGWSVPKTWELLSQFPITTSAANRPSPNGPWLLLEE